MGIFTRSNRIVLHEEIEGGIVDLGGVLVVEPEIVEIPGASDWVRRAAAHLKNKIVICSAQSQPTGHRSIIDVLKIDTVIPRHQWWLSAVKILSPTIYQSAAKFLGLAPAKVLVIDDRPDAIISALIAGCNAAWVSERDESLLFDALERRDRYTQIPPEWSDNLEQHVVIVPSVTAIEFDCHGR